MNELKKEDNRKTLPDLSKYMQEELISNSIKLLIPAQYYEQQIYYNKLNPLHTIHTYYEILKILDEILEAENQFLKKTDVINLYISAQTIFLVIFKYTENGILNFNNIPANIIKNLKNETNIDFEQCLSVAIEISLKKEDLLEKLVNKSPKDLNKSIKDNPIIMLKDQIFLITSYQYYPIYIFKSIINRIKKNNEEKILKRLGDVYEKYVQSVLENIFSIENVKKLKHEGKKADFLIICEDCILIIEVKKSLNFDGNITDPYQIVKMYKYIYNAYTQCSSSAKKYRNSTKPDKIIIPIIIIFEQCAAYSSSFKFFAKESGIFKDLEIDFIEIFDWFNFETILSKMSINKFVSILLTRRQEYINNKTGKTKFINDLDNDKPAHNYEHLKNAYELFQPKRIM